MDGFVELGLNGFSSAGELASEVLKLPFEHKVLSIGVVGNKKGWEIKSAP